MNWRARISLNLFYQTSHNTNKIKIIFWNSIKTNKTSSNISSRICWQKMIKWILIDINNIISSPKFFLWCLHKVFIVLEFYVLYIFFFLRDSIFLLGLLCLYESIYFSICCQRGLEQTTHWKRLIHCLLRETIKFITYFLEY